VTTLGELDEAMKSARASKSGAYIEIIGLQHAIGANGNVAPVGPRIGCARLRYAWHHWL
jgi:hypothetical protein